MNKRWIVLLCTGLVAGTLLVGCSKADDDATSKSSENKPQKTTEQQVDKNHDNRDGFSGEKGHHGGERPEERPDGELPEGEAIPLSGEPPNNDPLDDEPESN